MNTISTQYNTKELTKSLILGLISGIFLLIVISNIKDDVEIAAKLYKHKLGLIFFICSCLVIWVYIIYRFASKWKTALQFGRFVAVGQSNAAIDIGVLNFLIILSSIDSGMYYSVFKGVSFIFAVINSFLWNKFWSFGSKERDDLAGQFVKFIAVALVGLAINVLVASLVVNVLGPQWGIPSRIWANVGVLSSAIFNIVWDFYGFKVFVFKK